MSFTRFNFPFWFHPGRPWGSRSQSSQHTWKSNPLYSCHQAVRGRHDSSPHWDRPPDEGGHHILFREWCVCPSAQDISKPRGEPALGWLEVVSATGRPPLPLGAGPRRPPLQPLATPKPLSVPREVPVLDVSRKAAHATSPSAPGFSPSILFPRPLRGVVRVSTSFLLVAE